MHWVFVGLLLTLAIVVAQCTAMSTITCRFASEQPSVHIEVLDINYIEAATESDLQMLQTDKKRKLGADVRGGPLSALFKFRSEDDDGWSWSLKLLRHAS